MALWALATNPRGKPWAQHFAGDSRFLAVLLALVNKYKAGGTRNRFQPARLFAALTLGQLFVMVRWFFGLRQGRGAGLSTYIHRIVA